MRILVTGAAGFIGRWVVGELLGRGHTVLPVDSLVAGDPGNLAEYRDLPGLLPLEVGDIRDAAACRDWAGRVDAIAHLAASISVQDSIDDPDETFQNDVVGTFNMLEAARAASARFLFASSCMVYDRASTAAGIAEDGPTRPASPYAASKLSGEVLTLSYHHAYGLPTSVVRPFNTYGPFQRSVGEGGVVAIFTRRSLAGESLRIYGDGTQTRDLLYVEDCARFIADALLSDAAVGRILNAGTGVDVSVNALAAAIEPDAGRIEHVEHIHPQSEIPPCERRGPAARPAKGASWARQAAEGIARGGPARTRGWMAERHARVCPQSGRDRSKMIG